MATETDYPQELRLWRLEIENRNGETLVLVAQGVTHVHARRKMKRHWDNKQTAADANRFLEFGDFPVYCTVREQGEDGKPIFKSLQEFKTVADAIMGGNLSAVTHGVVSYFEDY